MECYNLKLHYLLLQLWWKHIAIRKMLERPLHVCPGCVVNQSLASVLIGASTHRSKSTWT